MKHPAQGETNSLVQVVIGVIPPSPPIEVDINESYPGGHMSADLISTLEVHLNANLSSLGVREGPRIEGEWMERAYLTASLPYADFIRDHDIPTCNISHWVRDYEAARDLLYDEAGELELPLGLESLREWTLEGRPIIRHYSFDPVKVREDKTPWHDRLTHIPYMCKEALILPAHTESIPRSCLHLSPLRDEYSVIGAAVDYNRLNPRHWDLIAQLPLDERKIIALSHSFEKESKISDGRYAPAVLADMVSAYVANKLSRLPDSYSIV